MRIVRALHCGGQTPGSDPEASFQEVRWIETVKLA